ncbi:MAG: hypothetical protein K6G88_10970 [Lachnospiraceae bacterium]|nr:hypothetical protein [Lachnospiraceae bacterium]
MEFSIGFQTISLDFAVVANEKGYVYSIFDRSAMMVRSMAVQASFDSVAIEGKTYGVPRNSEGDSYKTKRYIERFESGRDRVSSALIVNGAIGEKVFLTDDKGKYDDFYNFLMNNYTLPLLKEWSGYLYDGLVRSYFVSEYRNAVIGERLEREITLNGRNIRLDEMILVDCSSLDEEFLKRQVSTGLSSKKICITELPVKKLEFENLDEYYQKYGKNIVENLERVIDPLNEIDGYCPYVATKSKRLFPAQANGVNAYIKKFETSNGAIANMDMGTGKTLQALTTFDGFFNKKQMSQGKTLKQVIDEDCVNYVGAVLCPSHLVSKWVSEVSELPNAHAEAVTSLAQLIKINENRNLYKKGKHIFVFSKDFAKLGDMRAPIPTTVSRVLRAPYVQYCVDCHKNTGNYRYRQFGDRVCRHCGGNNWRKSLSREVSGNAVLCPHCNEVLIKNTTKKIDKNSYPEILTPVDFSSETSANRKCYNCLNPLWGAQVKNKGDGYKYKWKKLGYYTNKSRKGTSTAWILDGFKSSFMSVKNLKEDEVWESSNIGVRKYSPARYIQKHMKNFFDFFIADEAHMYESSSAQGQAFASLAKVSKKTLALTGTLTNGYAKGLFYLFWRIIPQKMVDMGYEFYGRDGVGKWNYTYGVLEKRTEYTEEELKYNTSSRGKKDSGMFKERPGVSPRLMKDFLLEDVIQLQISDLSEGLPELKEEIVSVEPEKEVVSSLNSLTNTLKNWASNNKCPAINIAALRYQLFYTDQPYDIPPILSPLTRGDIVAAPDNYPDLVANGGLLKKEIKLVEIVKKELEEGRRCYVFLENTGKSEFFLLKRIKKVLEENVPCAKPLIMEANSTSASKREDWMKNKIEKEKYNIVISNPRLVETGIDFVWKAKNGEGYNIPTIVFYQVGWSLATLWQASRRHYRLIQKEQCRTYYIVCEGTMQLECLQMMAEKQVAVSAIQGGEFSSRGLSSMAKGVDPKIELAKRMLAGEHSDVDDVKEMFKNISLSGSRSWDCKQNLLISDITTTVVKTAEKPSLFDESTWGDEWFASFFGSIKEEFENEKSKSKSKKRKEKNKLEQLTLFDLFE